MVFLLALMLSSVGYGSGLDADGAGLPVHDGRPVGLVSGVPRLGAGMVALGLRTALAAKPLVRANGSTTEELVAWSAGARAQAVVAPVGWLVFDLDLPVRVVAGSDVAIGSALGDLRVGGWWRSPVHRRLRWGVGVGVQTPTGSSDAFAGAGRVIPEARGSVAWDGVANLSGHLGLASEGAVSEAAAIGGLRATTSVRAGRKIGVFDIGLSARTRLWADKGVRRRRGTSAEAGLDATVDVGERLAVHGQITRALGSGAGTPVCGGGLGVVARIGSEPSPPPPPSIPMRVVTIVDPDGEVVAGADLVFPQGQTLVADASGRATWPLADGPPTISARGLRSVEASRRGPDQIVLPWRPVHLGVRVASATGVRVEPDVQVVGESDVTLARDASGAWTSQLEPGAWSLTVSADGDGAQSREIVVGPRRTRWVEIEVVLLEREGDARLVVDLRDPHGATVGGAEVRLDGVVVGTAGDGRIGIEGLAAADTAVAVDSRFFLEQVVDVDLSGGSGIAEVGLFYAPGTVRITAVGPNGPIPDGLVYVDGPRALPPVRLEESGEKLVQLGDGVWDLALSSPAFGLQERRVVVEPRGPVPLEAVFRLLPDRQGAADLMVRAVDVDGGPVTNVEVALDGLSLGKTGTGGELVARGLAGGPVILSGSGTGMSVAELALDLRDGVQVAMLPLRWHDGALRVAANVGATPVDARVDFAGPSTYPGARLGAAGRRLFEEVPTGEWEILASHPSGMEVVWATVGAANGRLTDVAIALGEELGDGVLDLTVRDPSGGMLSGVEVLIDGDLLVDTASGGRVRVKGLDRGIRALELRHPWFETWMASVDIGSDSVIDQQLEWRAGLIDVSVTDAGVAVQDALVYLDGGAPHDPVRLGADGNAVIHAGAGTWELLVSSPSAGLATMTLELEGEGRPPVQVPVELAAEGLVVTVVDRRGRPAVGAEVSIDGVVLGATNLSGAALIPVIVEDGAQLTVSHPAIRPPPAISVGASERERVIEVTWVPRDVAVRARHGDEHVAVRINANGPGRVSPMVIEGDGLVGLPPGRWELLASAEGLGTVRQFVEVPFTGEMPSVTFDLASARVRQTATGLQLIDVKFALGQDMAGAVFRPVLEEIAATIVADPRITSVEVHGHTDSTGGPRVNFDLSRRRAASVVEALVELGVPPNLLSARGYGSSRPVADNTTDEGRAENRRVDFRISAARID